MATIEEGKKAPAFSGKDQDGNTHNLSDYAGKKLVMYFYPKDNTPTCTVQACNLRDNYKALQKAGYSILGISPDEADKHKKFIEKFDLPFPLLADPERKIIEKFGVWGEKQMYGRKYMGLNRTTFIIDEKGIISRIINKPKSKEHGEEIMNDE